MSGVPSEGAELSRRNVVLRLGAGGVLGAMLSSGLLPVSAQEASPAAGDTDASPVGAYVAIRQYQFAGEHTMEELQEAVGSGFIPIVSEVPGFLDYYLIETADGAVSISVFQDQAGADESTTRAADWVQQTLADFFTGPPTVTIGTIRLHQHGAMA
jgi:hypothetical protein